MPWLDSCVMKALLIFSPPLASAGQCSAIALLPVLPRSLPTFPFPPLTGQLLTFFFIFSF